MLDEKDLQAIAAMLDKALDKKLEPIKKDLTMLKADMETVKADLDKLKEDSETTRGALNHLIAWSDEVSKAVDFPLPKS